MSLLLPEDEATEVWHEAQTPLGHGEVILSKCGNYRYLLSRTWGKGKKGHLTWVLLNPSTASHEKSDPTMTRVANFSRAFGYSGFILANLFARRATKPKDLFTWLRSSPDANAERLWNLNYLSQATAERSVIVGWGSCQNNLMAKRIEHVSSWIRMFSKGGLYCLGKTVTDDQPRHPLYLPKTARPQKWNWVTADIPTLLENPTPGET
jgi:hypothetical protein